jgi:hypothetical protein
MSKQNQITITEALAEVHLINKKLEKKRLEVRPLLTQLDHQTDPYEKDGGSKKIVEETLQSITDLENRLVSIRSAIAKANLNENITVQGETKTIFHWLAWRREVAENRSSFLNTTATTVQSAIERNATNPVAYKDKDNNDAPKFAKLEVNVDWKTLQEEREKIQTILGELDGQLSLKNATITVSI